MKNKIKNKKYIIIFLACLTFVLCVCFGGAYFTKQKDFVLKINDEYISKEEFLIYLYQQKNIFEQIGGVDIWQTDFDGIPAKDVAKNNAINAIMFLKASVYKAKELKIKLTDQQIQQCKQDALMLKQEIEKTIKQTIPLEICEKFEKEKLIEQQVYNYITDGFVVDEKDFLKYFNNYVKQNSDMLYQINLDYVFVQNNDTFDAQQKAQEILKKATLKTDFDTFKLAPFIKVEKNVTLQKDMFEKTVEEKIYKLKENSISTVIQAIDGFYIFKINKISNLDSKKIEDFAKTEYIQSKKDELYTTQINNWVNSISLEKNNKILNNL